MPGAGTDKTKTWVETPAPVIILVEPQLGENIGATARAMANFGISRLRLVKPRQGWPNPKAHVMAAGADRILENAQVFETVQEAVADCRYLIATTARQHDQAKPVLSPEQAAAEMAPRVREGEAVGIMFGRERNGLENDEVALADAIVTLPVNPAFASLNLAQAVLVIGYEWFKNITAGALPYTRPERSPPAPKQQLLAFFENIERELENVEFFRPPEKRETMVINLRNIFTRIRPTQQDIQTLHGVILSIAQGRKGPARGGILNGDEASMLRTLLAEHGEGKVPNERGPVRGLARLLRRNPTEAERLLWDALTTDKRFAGRGFKRQTPVGTHICDFVSFTLRVVVELIPGDESETASGARAARRAWLEPRGYRVVDITEREVETDAVAALDRLSEIAEAALPRS
jgi:tRNA/rRNA methyltransferase